MLTFCKKKICLTNDPCSVLQMPVWLFLSPVSLDWFLSWCEVCAGGVYNYYSLLNSCLAGTTDAKGIWTVVVLNIDTITLYYHTVYQLQSQAPQPTCIPCQRYVSHKINCLLVVNQIFLLLNAMQVANAPPFYGLEWVFTALSVHHAFLHTPTGTMAASLETRQLNCWEMWMVIIWWERDSLTLELTAYLLCECS